MISDANAQLDFFVVALSLWGAMALRYPAPVAFLAGYSGLAVFALDSLPPRMLAQPPMSFFWSLETITAAALLARLLVPRLKVLSKTAPALTPYAPAVTGSAAAFAFDEATAAGRPVSLASSMANTLAGLSPLGLPVIAAATMMQVSVGRIMVAAIVPAAVLTVVGAFLAGPTEGSTSRMQPSNLGAELAGPAVALTVLFLILAGVATPAEAFVLSSLFLLASLTQLGGLRHTIDLLNEALPDVARVVLLILSAAPVYALFYYVVRLDWMTQLWLDFPVIFFGLSLLAAAAFGMVGGSLAAVVAMVLLFAAPASASASLQPAQFLLAWILAAEGGRFMTARWNDGIDRIGAVWIFTLLSTAALALATDIWVLSIF